MRKILSFDAESNGLWGEAFAIGALVYDDRGIEIARFIGRLSDAVVTNEWVKKNVLPQLTEVLVTHHDYESLLSDFAKFYMMHKLDADIVVHGGLPVEVKIIIDMHTRGFIGDWEHPFPLHDVASYLVQVGEDPILIDSYVRKHKISIADDFNGSTHNPLYDSEVAARVFMHLRRRIQ